MLDRLKDLAQKAKNAVTSAAVLVGDLNGDGKVDEEDARVAAGWAKRTAVSVGDEAARLGREVARSDMAKDAAAGAAVGAVVAIPVPIIGPRAGAAIGASIGVYKNLTKKGQPASLGHTNQKEPELIIDLHAALIKIEDLRQKGILTDDEFKDEKLKLLGGRA